MSAARATLIRDKLVELLATLEPGNPITRPGEDEYTPNFALSAEGQVLAGRYARPPCAPFACVYWASTREEWGERLGDRLQRGTFIITAWAEAVPQDAAYRQNQAEQLASDIRTKLRSVPSLEGTVRQFLADVVVFDAVDPQRPDQAIWGAAIIEIRAEWIERG